MSAINASRSSRRSVSCPIFGGPEKLSGRSLPTYKDVMRHYLLCRFELKVTKKEPPIYSICQRVASDVLDIWNKESIPTVTQTRVVKLLQDYHSKYRTLLKPYKSRQNNSSYIDKITLFKNDAVAKLFDISACKCVSFSSCSCSREKKIPQIEQQFIMDQRTQRKLIIVSVDIATSVKCKKRETRKEFPVLTMQDQPSTSAARTVMEGLVSSTESSSESIASEYEPCGRTLRRIEAQNKQLENPKVSLENFAVLSDKTGVSDRAAATLASAMLEGVGLVTEENSDLVIDRHKIRRARKRVRCELQNEMKVSVPFKSVYFDGRKDDTRVTLGAGSRTTMKTVKEEHVSLLQEPGSKYIGHVSPATGSAKSITSSILDFF